MEQYKHLSPQDLLATVTEFAAYAITRSITDNVKAIDTCSVIMASGGGTRNAYLMAGSPHLCRSICADAYR